MVETNPNFSYWSVIKMLTRSSSQKFKLLGKLGNLFQDGVVDISDVGDLTSPSNEKKKHLKDIRGHGHHLKFSVMSDIA